LKCFFKNSFTSGSEFYSSGSEFLSSDSESSSSYFLLSISNSKSDYEIFYSGSCLNFYSCKKSETSSPFSFGGSNPYLRNYLIVEASCYATEDTEAIIAELDNNSFII
jgi:hypothetical protein